MLDGIDSALPDGLTIEAVPAPDTVESGVALSQYILRNPAGQQAPFYLLPGLHIEISASQIRDQIRSQSMATSAAPKPHPALLPPSVLEYILAHNLYR